MAPVVYSLDEAWIIGSVPKGPKRTLPYLERPAAEGGLSDSVKRPLDVAYTTKVLALEQERLKTLGEAAERVSFFFVDELTYDTKLLIQKGMDAARTREALVQARELLAGQEQWEHAAMETPIRELGAQLGLKPGQMLGTLRAAVSGSPATPPLFPMMEVLGRDACLKRIDQAIERLQ